MKSCTILLTCVGGLISPSQVASFKNNQENREVRVIGVDNRREAIGKYLQTDKFYQVPLANDQNYLKKMFEICRREKIQVIFPTSNEEALVLSKNRKLFEKLGAKIAISDYEVLQLAFNKATAYSFLKENNLPCPKFFIVRSAADFSLAAKKLGFPKKEIVMKPPEGRGGRGVRILTNKSIVNLLIEEKPGSLYANFEETLKALKIERKFPELILMEYLPGTYWSVDFLAREGKAVIIVPKLRIEGNPSQTLVGQVKKNPKVEKIIRDISQVFNFNYNINIEMKVSENNEILPYDLNPRPAASVAFCSAAGANLIYYALKLALGEAIPENIKIKDGVKMIRYYKELYV